MKSRVLILFVISFISLNSAQTNSESDSSENSNEVQIYFIDNLLAAYKYNLTESSALRFRINFMGSYDDQNTNANRYNQKSHFATANHYFEININYLYQMNLNQIVNLYFGGGPFVSYQIFRRQTWTDKYNSENVLIDKDYNETKEDIWNTGVSVLAGFEFIVYKGIRLFTEYEADLTRGWDTRRDYPYIYENKIDSWSYKLKGIRVGAGVYF